MLLQLVGVVCLGYEARSVAIVTGKEVLAQAI
jgi:hypothetical protein